VTVASLSFTGEAISSTIAESPELSILINFDLYPSDMIFNFFDPFKNGILNFPLEDEYVPFFSSTTLTVAPATASPDVLSATLP